MASQQPGGFTFGTPSTTTPQTTSGVSGFQFGASAIPAAQSIGSSTSFQFGANTATNAAATPGSFQFGVQKPTNTPSQNVSGFQLGVGATLTTPATQSLTGFALGGASVSTTTQPAGGLFSFQNTAAKPADSAGFSFGLKQAPSSGFNFTSSALSSTIVTPTTSAVGLQISQAAPTQSFNQAAVAPNILAPGATRNTSAAASALASTPSTGFLLSTPATSASTGFQLGGGFTSTPVTTGLRLEATASIHLPTMANKDGPVTATTTGIGFGMPKTTPAAEVQPLSLQTTSVAPTVQPTFQTTTTPKLTSTFTVTSAPVTTTVALTTATVTSAATAPQSMNYRQLEESINKWTLELEEQEKSFLNQATLINTWDRVLIDNGEKITQLNVNVEKVKLDQQRLDHELDFILAEQKELENMLVTLEKSVEEQPALSYPQHADLEREHTYQLAENIDGQLKRMVSDLKEIIDHLNRTNESQDADNPMKQITKILNAHMDSLQWVDENTALLRRKVDEVGKLYDTRRKEQERSFKLAYD